MKKQSVQINEEMDGQTKHANQQRMNRCTKNVIERMNQQPNKPMNKQVKQRYKQSSDRTKLFHIKQ